MRQILVYGSLKRGFFNFNRCGKQDYIKTFRLNGFEMYDLGHYPCIVEGQGEITVELHEVDELTYRYISAMEEGAGYESKQINGATIYYYPSAPNFGTKIKSGNYI